MIQTISAAANLLANISYNAAFPAIGSLATLIVHGVVGIELHDTRRVGRVKAIPP